MTSEAKVLDSQAAARIRVELYSYYRMIGRPEYDALTPLQAETYRAYLNLIGLLSSQEDRP